VSLRFAILTALAERPSTGLELARRFDRAFGYFWSASHQQIYREFERLSTDGLIAEVAESASPGRGQPRRFSITSSGLAALQAWVGEINEPTPPRQAIIVKMRAAAALGDLASIRAVLTHHLQVHESAYAGYLEIQARDFSVIRDDADTLKHLVLKSGLRMERASADWCREAIEAIDEMTGRAGQTATDHGRDVARDASVID
jgi:DNA-binding PadR family transcriptional regulator